MYSISDHLVFWAGVRYTPPYLAKKANKKTKNLLVNLRRVGKFDCLLGVEIHSNTIIFVMCNINVLGSIRENASYSSAIKSRPHSCALRKRLVQIGCFCFKSVQIGLLCICCQLEPHGVDEGI